MSTAATVGAAPVGLGNLRHLALSAFWFGNFFLWLPLTTVLVQSQVDAVVPKASQGTAISIAIGLGGFLAMTVPPLVGAWSDRLNTRWGRRRPIMVAGTLLTIPGLLLLMTATGYAQVIVGLAIVQFFFNAAGAAYAGIIPDVVPAQEFGKASGLLATMVQVGGGAGYVVQASFGSNRAIYLVFAAVVLLTMLPTLWAAHGEGMTPIERPPSRPLGEVVREFLRPLHEGDFAWVIFTRLMVSAGITAVSYYLFNFFRDVVGVANPDSFTPTWFVVVLAAAVPFGLAGGFISDRLRRRKIFVYLSGGFQGFVALTFIVLYPTAIPLVFALGVAYGVGYGLYYAVDWALACDTLPDRSRSAKDMGLFHIALTLPQSVVPFLAGPVLDYFNRQSANSGYRVVFSSAILFLLLGTVLVSRIRTVR